MSINKVILIGRLGNDPDIRYTQNGQAVASISLATSEKWKDKQTGEMNELTEWHRVVFFARQAEICGEFLRKGSMIYVEGRLQTRKWQDKAGNDKYSTEIIGNIMQMLDRKQRPQDYAERKSTKPAADYGGREELEDDIPF